MAKGFGLTWQIRRRHRAAAARGEPAQAPGAHLARHPRPRAEACAGGVEVEVEQAGGAAKKFIAPAVVIADGGFQANLDMLRASGISPAPEKLLARNGGTAIGDGLRMAQAWAQHRAAA